MGPGLVKIILEVILEKMFKEYSKDELKKKVQGDFCFVVCKIKRESKYSKGKGFYEVFIEPYNCFDDRVKHCFELKTLIPERGYRGVNPEFVSELSHDINRLNERYDEDCKHLQRGLDFVLEDMDRVLLN